MRYTYFVAYAAISNEGNRFYGRCQVDRSAKISNFDDVKAIERNINEESQGTLNCSVVVTNFILLDEKEAV